LHRILRLDFINGKTKKAVKRLVSVIKLATLKALIESKLEMVKSELKKDFLEFVGYLKKMAIIHDEHCHIVEHKKTGDSGMKNTGTRSDAGSRSSEHNSGGSLHGGASNKSSDRDRTKSGHGRSSEAKGTGKQSVREPPPCLSTKKCAGEKHFLSNYPHTGKDEAIVLLSEYKKKRDADKKKANFKTLDNNRATTENRDGQTAYLTAENLRVKVTVLADTGSGFSYIPRSAVEDARKRGFPLKVEVLPEPIMLTWNQGRRRQADVQCDGDAHVGGDNHYVVGASVHSWSATDHCRRRCEPSIDLKAGLRRDGFRGKSASGLCTGQIPPARLQTHCRGAIGDGQAAFGRPVKACTQARGHSRVY
jgi:hypothetical protein